MKNLEKQEKWKRIRHNSWKTFALATMTALSLNLTSCKAPTQVDIVKDKQKIEVVSNQLSLLKDQRKEMVNQYNKYLRLTGTPWYDNLEFENEKARLYDAIVKKDKEIVKAIKHKWKLEGNLNKDQVKALEKSPNPNEPMDPDKFNFAM